MTGNVLITLGRLPKGLELARAFARIGCRVVIAEPHRWHLSRVSRAVSRSIRVTAPNTDTDGYLRQLTEVVHGHDIDLVVPVSDETMHVAALRERLPPHVRLYCPPQPELLELHDKLRFVRLAARHGLQVPETYLASDPAADALSARERCIVKPVNSSAGVGLQVLERGASPPVEAGEASVVQAFVPGDELSTFSIAHEGRVIGTAVYVGRVMSGTVAVCFERLPEPPPALLTWVERFAGATGYTGFLSFDFRLDADGRPLAIECNPRTTSGVHFIHPQDLANAILEPGATSTLRFRRRLVLQQFYPALTEIQVAALRGQPVRGKLRYLFGTRDVCWQASDPLPLLLMPLVSFEILGRTMFRGESFGEASTFDIGWHGDAVDPGTAERGPPTD